ncbi:MAG: hypothetical protein KFB93_08975 [Simkaniaceae bacterium]|nr:MAG: hypothetical protein KFB93_08975 [Simkaniaceae bacterium]
MSTVLHRQSSDIFVKDRPVGLSSHAPDIFQDYAISRDTAISIMPSMEKLLADPSFRGSVRDTLGKVTLVDIKVRGEDGAVLVRDPRIPHSQFTRVDYQARAAVRDVSDKTQVAYSRFRDSQSSSLESSPRRVESPVYDHPPQFARAHSFQHMPSPSFDRSFYDSRMRDLESENRELRGRLENVELRQQLDRSEHLLEQTRRELRASESEVAELSDTIADLQDQLAEEQETHQRTNANLQLSVLGNIVLAAALLQMGGRNTQLERQLHALQEQHRALEVHSGAHGIILQRAQELVQADSPADLIKKIKGLQTALASEQERSGRLEHSLSESEQARRALDDKLRRADEELARLRPENGELRRDLEAARRELAEIREAVKFGIRPRETLPELAARYHATITDFQSRLGETLQINSVLQETIQGVREQLPEAPDHNRDLPGAVRALRTAHEESVQARQALHEELEALKRQDGEKGVILDRIGVVLDKKGEPHENLPDLVRALGEENGELKARIAEHVVAQVKQAEILQRVGDITGETIDSIEDLPGAVQAALGKVEKRAEASDRRADSLSDRVRELTQEMEQATRAHKKEVAALQERALQAESALLGEQSRVEEQQLQAEALRRNVGEARRALETAQHEHTEAMATLRDEMSELKDSLRGEKRTTQALQQQVAVLQQTARDAELRHQEALRRQEIAHQRAIKPLRADVERVTHLNEEQARGIASLSEQLEQAREALSVATKTGRSQEASIVELTDQVSKLESALEKAQQATRESDQRRESELLVQEEAHQSVLTPLQAELQEAREALSVAIRTGKSQEASVAKLTKRVSELEEALEAAHQATRDSDQRRARELHEQEEAHQEILGPLQDQLQRAEASLLEATSSGKSQQASILALTKEVATLKEALEARAQISGAELERLREESEQLRALLGQIDAIAREVPIEREPKSLADELEEMSIGPDLQALEKIQQGPQYEKLPGEVQEVITALLKEIRELKQKDLIVRDKEATIADLELQLKDQGARSSQAQAALQEEIEELHADLLQVKNDAISLGQKQAGLIGTLRETLRRERMAAAKDQRLKLERINELEDELGKAERTIKILQHTIEKQGIEIQAQTERADHYESYSDELLQKKKELRQIIKGLQKALTEMEADRDSWREEAGQYEASYTQLRREHTELQSRSGHLEEEVAQLRQILATTLSVEPTLDVHQFIEARRDLQGRIAHMENTIEVLSGKVARVEKSKARIERREEQTAEERDAALKKAAATERQRRLEEQGRLSAESARDRLLEDLDGAHGLARSQTRQLEESTLQMKGLRMENAKLREALEAHQDSAAEHERDLQRAIEAREAELQRMHEIEEARRAKELSESERQQLRAADAGEIMGEIAQGMDQGGLSLEDIITDRRMLASIQEYLKSMKKGALPSRHAQKASSEISQLNSTPYPLSDLRLFTGFFGVTDHISGLRASREFLHLKANNEVLRTLSPETQQEAIKRIKAQNAAIIRNLLTGFFARLNEVTGPGSKFSRFSNIGMQLWVWNSIFHGLSEDFYDGAGGEKAFKKTRVKGVDLANAEGMRTTVLDLHTRFQQMMRPFLPV